MWEGWEMEAVVRLCGVCRVVWERGWERGAGRGGGGGARPLGIVRRKLRKIRYALGGRVRSVAGLCPTTQSKLNFPGEEGSKEGGRAPLVIWPQHPSEALSLTDPYFERCTTTNYDLLEEIPHHNQAQSEA